MNFGPGFAQEWRIAKLTNAKNQWKSTDSREFELHKLQNFRLQEHEVLVLISMPDSGPDQKGRNYGNPA
jgi:hypothetical protein